MTDSPKCVSTPKQLPPSSIFASEFLELISDLSVDGHCEFESSRTGPWRVAMVKDGFKVVRDGDERPRGIFKHHETACLVAAVLPAVGSDVLYAVRRESAELVRNVGRAEPAVIGRIAPGEEDLAAAIHIAAWFLRSPHSLAYLLEAAGYDVLATAGRLVAERRAGKGAAR